MTANPFFGYFEQGWIDHQTNYGQQTDPCIGLSCDQLYQRVDQWLAEFWQMDQPSIARDSIRVGIVQRFYGNEFAIAVDRSLRNRNSIPTD